MGEQTRPVGITYDKRPAIEGEGKTRLGIRQHSVAIQMKNGKWKTYNAVTGANILHSPFYILYSKVRSVSVPNELGAFVGESVARAAASMIEDAIIVRSLPDSVVEGVGPPR